MKPIESAYVNALLADASYVSVSSTFTAAQLTTRLQDRMTPTQAAFIAANFEVLDSVESPGASGSTGFDAVVWRGKAGSDYAGKVFVSMRGTQGAQDLLDDVDLATSGLAHKQLRDMVNWWLRATTLAGQAVEQIAIRESVVPGSPVLLEDFESALFTATGTGKLTGVTAIESVNGHSLGGYMAASFVRLFGGHWPVTHFSTFNSAGFSDVASSNIENGFNQIANVLGAGAGLGRFANAAEQTNFFAENGINFTTNDWTTLGFNQYGQRVSLFQEDTVYATDGGITNHFMYKLTDAMALGFALEKLDSTITVDRINQMLRAGSNDVAGSYEGALDGLRRVLINATATPTESGDASGSVRSRLEFHQNLKNLTDTAAFKALVGKAAITLANSSLSAVAKIDFGAFLSLSALSPLVISTTDPTAISALKVANTTLAAQWDADALLSTDQREKGLGNFTNSWMTDRTAMLLGLVSKNIANGDKAIGATNTNYFDIESNTTVTQRISGMGLAAPANWITFGTDSPDRINGSDNAVGDHLYGMGGNDELRGGAGADLLDGGRDDDQLHGGHGKDTLLGGSGGDYIWGDGGGDTLVGGIGADHVWGGADDDTIYGDLRDPISDAIAYDDELFGESGRDNLYGGRGNDTLTGGVGDDRLYGGAGNDTYVFNIRDGNDVISDGSGVDTIRLDVRRQDVTFARDGTDILIFAFADQLRILNGMAAGQIENFEFADGVHLDAAGVQAQINRADLQLQSWNGGIPADYPMIYGSYGNDTLYSGPYNVYMAPPIWHRFAWRMDGGTGNDTYVFEGDYGRSTILDFTGVDTIRFGPGINPSQTYVSVSYSGAFLTTKRPDIFFEPSSYYPVYSYWDSPDHWAMPIDVTSAAIERVEFNDGTIWNLQEMVDALVAKYWEGTDASDSWPRDLFGSTPRPSWQTNLEGGYINNRYGFDETVSGHGGDDTLTSAPGGDDILAGGTGNDRINLVGENNTVIFDLGDGQDTILNNSHSSRNLDRLKFGDGIYPYDIAFARINDSLQIAINGTSDQLIVANWWNGQDRENRGINQVEFTDGTVWDADELLALTSLLSITGGPGNDVLFGDQGDNTLDGKAGNDTMKGGDGNDTYLFFVSGGMDIAVDNGGEMDAIQFGAGIAPSDIAISRSGMDVVLRVIGTTDQVSIKDWGQSDVNRIEVVRFAEGTVWDGAYIASRVPAESPATIGDDVLQVWWGDNATTFGLAGNDVLLGSGDANVLDGGPGNDTLNGGLGNDTYLFNIGGGQDLIDDTGGELDVIKFGTGIGSSGIAFARSGMDLVLRINGTSDQLTLRNWGEGDARRLERIEFIDGSSLGTTHLAHIVEAQQIGGAGDDVLRSWAGEDAILFGMASNDMLLGNSGNDIIDGGIGDDVLVGAAGNDTYVFDRGYGKDTISDTAGTDGIKLAVGLVAADVSLSRSGADLYLSINGTDDVLTIPDWFYEPEFRVESVEFADDTIWDTLVLAAAKFLGTEGVDNMAGSMESDLLEGRGGDDVIAAYDGHDILDGGAGSDSLSGGLGNDTYRFGRGDGQDTIRESDTLANSPTILLLQSGVDTILLKTGVAVADVSLWRDASNLYLGVDGTTDMITVAGWFDDVVNRVERVEFADGTVWDQAVMAAAKFVGTEDADVLTGSAANEVIEGRGGNDAIAAAGGEDILDGGTGNDTLAGGTGNDSYVFGLGYGQDSVTDEEGVDVITLGTGLTTANVELWRDASNLYLGIANGTDVLSVQGWFVATSNRVESVQFTDGTVWGTAVLETAKFVGTEGPDYMTGGSGSDMLEGLGGDDSVQGDAGDDTLDGGTGSDSLGGGAGNDRYIFGRGYGQDTILDTDATAGNLDTVVLKSGVAVGDVTLSRDASNLYLAINGTEDKVTITGWYDDTANRVERIEFSDGTVWDAAIMAAAKFTGTDGPDYLTGGSGSDFVEGRGGNDSLTTDAGDDTLDGGTGNDALDGGAGNDSYVFGMGYGQDTAVDADGVDVIKLGAGIAPANVQVWRDTSNLYLGLSNSTDVVTVQGWFDLATNRVESVAFADGTVWDTATLAAAAFGGTAGADSIYGTTGNDTLQGFGGDDSLNGDAGDDILTGGTDNDALDGGSGNDRYLFARGDGQDIIHETDSTAGNSDTIALASGIAVRDLALSRDASNLYLAINGTTDKITVSGWYDDPANRVERIEFADGTVWDAAVMAAAKLSGTEGPDYLSGSAGNDALEGRGGNDTLTTDAGDDILDGGTENDALDGGVGNDRYLFGLGYGQDTISDADGVDVIKLGAGVAPASVELWRDTSNLYLNITNSTDVLTVQGWFDLSTNRVESVQFADGTIWNTATLAAARIVGTAGVDYLSGTTGNDVLEGRGGDDTLAADAGDDTLDGGTGVDSLDGAAGNDSYLFGLGYGQDTITDAAGTDVIKLGAGVAAANVQMWRDTSNLYLGLSDSTDVLTVQGWFDLTTNRVESVQFADSTVWNTAALAAAAFGGTPGPDSIYGTTGNDTLLGFGGDDSITGDTGNDTLDGGTGSDTLDGGAGNDGYVFGIGYGQDEITDASGTDVIKLGAGLTTANVQLWRDTSNLYLGITGSADVVSVQGWFDATTNRVESIQFADSTIWNTTALAAAAFGGTPGADSIYGTTGNNTLNGYGGNDYLWADAGNDVLDGGTGDDMLDGGAGNDTYKFGRGYRLDTVAETSGTTDLIQFDANTAPADVLVSRDASHLYLSILGTTDKLTIQNWYADALYRVEQVSFVGGTNWTVANLNAKTTTTTEAADSYWGTTSNDTVNGLGGDDQLVGNEGNDALSGGAGNDVLNGGTGSDTLLGGLGDDSYIVDVITDVVTESAGEGSDTVRTSVTYTLGANLERLELLEAGGAINGTGNGLANTLVGNSANNILNGGAGADTLIGGVGNDTYVVDDAADVTTENLSEGTDLVNASLSWTLSANMEKLTLTGTAAINGTGNELANTLTGNSAANVLTGGAGNDALNGAAGADTLIGGLGNDSYTVDNAADVTTESPGEGTDTVSANRSWTLGANLENLTLAGSTLINATGNELNNVLTGNSAANVLTGGLGNDTLKGMAGNDQYIFGRGMGADLVQENDTTAGNTDLLQFLSGVTIEQVWLRKVSNDLEVSVIGTTDKVTFTNWYLNSQYHVEQFKTSDGKTLADTDVQNLVNAMAGYALPAQGELTLPTDYWTALSSVITGNWH